DRRPRRSRRSTFRRRDRFLKHRIALRILLRFPPRNRRGRAPSILTMAHAWDFDVAVVGGGPGGSSAAAALARRGHSVLVIERLAFPRFHIGESQLPWINGVLATI